MQIIQSSLGNNIHPLGVISSLSNSQGIILRKESHSLHSRNNFISTIQTKPPLVKSSKFFLSRQYEPSIEPLIGWDSWDTQDITSDFSEFTFIEFDASDSIAALDNSNESVKNSIPKIMPTPTETNTSNGTSQEVNIKTKSQQKKTNKSQKPLKKEPKSKSRTKKAIKSSSPKNFEPIVDKTNINLNKDNLLISDESMPIEANLETPNLQLDIVLDSTTKDHSSVSSPTVDTSPSLQDQSTLFENFATDDLSENSELISSFSSTDLSLPKNTLTSEENIELEDDTSELVNSSSIEVPSKKNTEKIFIQDIHFTDNEEKLIPEVSESVHLSDMQVSQTSPQQDIETDKIPYRVDNKSSVSQTNLIQAKDILPILNSLSQEEESPDINTKFEEVTANEADLISEQSTNDFVTDNSASDNSLNLSSALTSSEVDDSPTLLRSLENNENTVETDFTSPNSESSVAKNPITVQQEIDPDFSHNVEKATQNLTPQPSLIPDNSENLKPLSFQDQGFLDSMKSQEIDSSVTSEFPDIAPVQLSPTSAVIEDTPSLFSNPDSDEQLVTSESQSAMVVNVSDISANVTSLQRDSNVQNLGREFTESQPILAAPEITETPTISATSPEIDEALVVNANSPKITETPTVSATSPEIDEALVVSTNSPEITETPTISATSPEITEAPTISATSPEIDEALVVSTNSPKIAEAPTISATSPEIDEGLVVSANSPEIAETPTISATSPEINEALVFSANSPEIIEKTSIFREIIDNEQTVESENPEISTADTWDNPDILDNSTSPQDEVSTAPKVEQNAIAENLPAPKGYATGGHVTDSRVENRQQIAPSDTVPAMLTPGEFVINTRDAQKNLPLLHHINTGGTPQDIILPSLQTPNPTEPEATTSPETPTKVDSFPDTSLQLKSAETDSPEISNSLIPSYLGLNSNKQKLSILNSPQLHTLQNKTIDVGESSPQYSSPPLIFRKANSSTHTPSQWSDTPSQWSSVEDLLNGNNDDFTSFNFNDGESNSQNYEFSHVSESPQVFAKHLPSPRGFANGGEVTPPDISREIQPITETIESASSSSPGDEKDDTADLEALAREVYHRLRQRIEIERERHGGYSGRLPW
ncbi:hypothetical protein IQ274_24380 [Nostoc sp. LEGE 12447]|uniref:hypothetical protein n=1 Tax=Nostoc sp. LEGE 12447 TaxID=1828640 RepID=UPI0018842FE1|nr:hypothetical protein [Nostoc sp. LEGE 12447]MBE9001269.1 hypothetical protein [Nostoc sp. LEGE 12447]